MGLDYSQKQLLSTASYEKKRGKHATLSSMRRKRPWKENLQMYAFWTGFASTIISLLQVVIIALKK